MMKEFIQKTTWNEKPPFSHESRRMFENNPVKIIEMLPKIQPHLAAKRIEFSAAVVEFRKEKKNI